jgi:hypothetical protein
MMGYIPHKRNIHDGTHSSDYAWWNADPTAPEGSSLPKELFAKLERGRLANLKDFRVYPTIGEAMDALQDALET